MGARTTHGVQYAWIAAAVMGSVAGIAWLVEDQWLVLSAAILGLYVLHLFSVRYLVRAQADQLSALTGADATTRAAIESPVESRGSGSGPLADQLVGNGKPGESDIAETSAVREMDETSGEPASVAETAVAGPDQEVSSGPTLREVSIPRHFMLGTVAIVRHVMEPEAVARVLMEQRRQPGKRFGELAVEMDLITEPQLDDLLQAQQNGLFTDAEIREARQRLETFRRSQAAPAKTA